jgi:hypothetical protein
VRLAVLVVCSVQPGSERLTICHASDLQSSQPRPTRDAVTSGAQRHWFDPSCARYLRKRASWVDHPASAPSGSRCAARGAAVNVTTVHPLLTATAFALVAAPFFRRGDPACAPAPPGNGSGGRKGLRNGLTTALQVTAVPAAPVWDGHSDLPEGFGLNSGAVRGKGANVSIPVVTHEHVTTIDTPLPDGHHDQKIS